MIIMNLKYMKKATLLIGIFFSGIFMMNAQNTKSNFSLTKGGHAAYKNTKLYDSKTGKQQTKKNMMPGDKAADRAAYEFKMLKNPYTGKIPRNIKVKEKEFAKKLPKGSFLKKLRSKNLKSANAKTQGPAIWSARGPGNVGGRTRALALDLDNENIILAGGVSGGLWRSTDTGASWTRVTLAEQNPSITAIVQDPRPGFTNIWYYSSGELFGNSANIVGGLYQGTGIYKSTDSGLSWARIESTNNLNVLSVDIFDYINDLAVSPLNGDLYFAAPHGVYRIKSSDLNTIEKVFDATESSFTEVEISATGKIYVTSSKEDGVDASNNNINVDSRISVSSDGNTWTDITPTLLDDTALYLGRIVVSIDPSNENFVWLLADNIVRGEQSFLLRYQVDIDTWVNRSSGMPYNLKNTGNFNSQGGYNMVLKVNPSDSNMVYVGGVSLYRSTNGFSETANTNGWIGGYSRANNYELYENHHPDIHNLVFIPSNPSKAISASDGGLHLTQNIKSGKTVWTSLNNKYLTTQARIASFDPSGTSNQLLAGFQDNGTWWIGGNTDIDDPWYSQYSGDGGHNAIADGSETLYVSSQKGSVYRLEFDNQNNFMSTRVTPSISSGNFGFLSPFILDHNNDNIMYMPRGGNMLVNKNLDEIPKGSIAPTSTNWSQISGNTLGSNILSLDVSTYPEHHKLYFGAEGGGVFRVDNAHLPTATRSSNLIKGKGLGEGPIGCVYVDPTNSDRVFITKSNYGVRSIWMSENEGNSWTDISGNLEENPDGSGNGPSVRWFSTIGNNEGYLVGTSTGLYYTETLAGRNTIWTRETLDIGTETIEDVVVSHVKTRKDGFAVASTHGNGLFSANFAVNPRPQVTLSSENINNVKISNAAGSYSLDVSENIKSSTNSPITMTIESNSNPSLCSINLVGKELQFTNIDPTKKGKVDIVIKGTSGIETITMLVKADIREIGIYDQSHVKDSFLTPCFFDVQKDGVGTCADDFVVPEGVSWNLNRVFLFGKGGGSLTNANASIKEAGVNIYEDNNGEPGTMVYTTGKVSGLNLVKEPDGKFNLNIPFPQSVELQPGKYWISAYPYITSLPFFDAWYWDTTENVTGSEAMFKNPKGYSLHFSFIHFSNVSLKHSDWTSFPDIYFMNGTPPKEQDLLFYIMGEAQTLNTENFELEAFKVYPNPNEGEFRLKFSTSSTSDIDVQVYDVHGRTVFHKMYQPTQYFDQNINLNSISSGIYILKVNDGVKKTTKKIIIK